METKKIGKYLIEVERDNTPDSPRSWDNLGKMVCFHRKYNLGDKHNYKFTDYENWVEQKQDIIKNEDVCVILPIYMYDHSGITIKTTPFGCNWDSGQIGWIFISKERVRNEFSVKRISKKLKERITGYLENEVKTYDQYLSGDVYMFRIYEVKTCELGHEHKEMLDSCCGYYGEDVCMNEAEDIVETYMKPKQLELELN